MKQKLMELHALPRQLLGAEIQRIGCTRGGQFNMADQGCWGCEVGAECVSMLKVSLDDRKPLTHLSTDQLKTSLIIAKRFIDDLIRRQSHPSCVCGCELCNWSHQANFVLSVSAQTMVNVPAPGCLH